MKNILLFILIYTVCNSQQINWKSFFTFNPDEGLKFTIDTTIIINNAGVPGINISNSGSVILGWAGGAGGRKAGISFDTGKTFVPVSYIQPMQIDGGFIYLPDGRTRFVTEEPAPDISPSRHKSRLISWISNDGCNWVKEAGIRFQPGEADDSISSVCEVIQLKDSLWRMYYVGDWYRTNGTRTAISTDWGMTWTAESVNNILRKGDVDPHPVYLSNGRFRLYFRSGMNMALSKSGISCCESDDGLNFDTTKIIFLFSDSAKPSMLKLDPMVIKYHNGRIACYIGAAPWQGQTITPRIIAAWSESPTGVTEPENIIPKNFALYQNYPNPFNPTTIINYEIPDYFPLLSGEGQRERSVSLKVYDILGNLVEILANKEQPAGRYSVEWNASKYSSGIYFYELRAGDFRSIKKMMLIK